MPEEFKWIYDCVYEKYIHIAIDKGKNHGTYCYLYGGINGLYIWYWFLAKQCVECEMKYNVLSINDIKRLHIKGNLSLKESIYIEYMYNSVSVYPPSGFFFQSQYYTCTCIW